MNRQLNRVRCNLPRLVTLALLISFTNASCSRVLYRVAVPLRTNAPAFSLDQPQLASGAHLLTSDETLEQFAANLPLAGVWVVDWRLVNRSEAALSVSALQVELVDAAGAALGQLLAPAQALELVMKYYGNRIYAPGAPQATLESYQALAFAQVEPLAAGAERRGLLFFTRRAIQAKLPPPQTNAAGLRLSGLGDAVIVALR